MTGASRPDESSRTRSASRAPNRAAPLLERSVSVGPSALPALSRRRDPGANPASLGLALPRCVNSRGAEDPKRLCATSPYTSHPIVLVGALRCPALQAVPRQRREKRRAAVSTDPGARSIVLRPPRSPHDSSAYAAPSGSNPGRRARMTVRLNASALTATFELVW